VDFLVQKQFCVWTYITDRYENYLAGEQVDNLEAVLDDPDGHQLLAVVTSMHHQGVDLKEQF